MSFLDHLGKGWTATDLPSPSTAASRGSDPSGSHTEAKRRLQRARARRSGLAGSADPPAPTGGVIVASARARASQLCGPYDVADIVSQVASEYELTFS